jgi:hypothetical protein
MKTNSTWIFPLLTIASALVFASAAQATPLSFTLDTLGTASGLTAIAPTTADQGKYNSGSWLTLSGSISATASGLTATGNFATQSGQGLGGTFSTGNPGSLTSFFNGTLLANVDLSGNTIAFPGGSTLNAGIYNAKYPEVANPPVNLIPAIGGGTSAATPGSDPANFGIAITLKALGFLTAASGNAALRNSIYDVAQTVPLSNDALTPSGSDLKFTTSGNIGIGQPQGNLDYNLKGATIGTIVVPDIFGTGSIGSSLFTPSTDGQGTVTVVNLGGNNREIFLTVPIKATILQTITGSTPATITLTVVGQMAAFAFTTVPEPASMTMLGVGLTALIPIVWYRRRKRSG